MSEWLLQLLQSYGVPSAAVLAVLTILAPKFPWLTKWLPKNSGVNSDARPTVSAALSIVADHGASMKCPKLKKAADTHCTALAEIVIRRPGYQPGEADLTPDT